MDWSVMDSISPPQRVSRRSKIAVYVGAWLIALIATNPTGSLWPLIYMFPLGLAGIFYPPGLRSEGWWLLFSCYLVYVLHAHFFFRARLVRAAYIWFAVLVILLICNVSGCRDMIDTH